jgi:hypothetical protein
MRRDETVQRNMNGRSRYRANGGPITCTGCLSSTSENPTHRPGKERETRSESQKKKQNVRATEKRERFSGTAKCVQKSDLDGEATFAIVRDFASFPTTECRPVARDGTTVVNAKPRGDQLSKNTRMSFAGLFQIT